MFKLRDLYALGVSLGVHLALLVGLYVFKLTVIDNLTQLDLETVFETEREQIEFTKELELNTEVAQTFNTVPGGVVTGDIGASTSPVVTPQKVERSEMLQQPAVPVSLSEVTLPSENILGKDFGESQITGEVGAAVEGYGAALSRITQELARMMRSERLLVVWLFDESGSMKDDQKEIAANFHKVYEELGILSSKDEQFKDKRKRGEELVLTEVLSFGEKVHQHTPGPTADIEIIKSSIGKIPEDATGIENTCQTILASVEQYGGLARRQDRRLVMIIVSDESGDDVDNADVLETTIQKLKTARVPTYFLGRESMFGYPYARIRWIDPKFNLSHWLQVRRGPETPQVECLQWDGLHARWDTQNAGFGPYAQVRMARETGGIFFILPGEEEDLVNAGAFEKRKYEFLDMKEYQPVLAARREYIQERDRTEFRKTVFDVITRLNPHLHSELSIKEIWYPLELGAFTADASAQVGKAAFAMSLLDQAIPLLDKIRPLRDTEASQRWRANYDLAYAQLVGFRVRLFQFLLAMDDHVARNPKPQKPESNAWNVGRQQKMLIPDEAQFQRLKSAFKLKMTREEFLAELEVREKEARNLLLDVVREHPNTPWAGRAQWELNQGFGMNFHEAFRNPNYDQPVQLPNL